MRDFSIVQSLDRQRDPGVLRRRSDGVAPLRLVASSAVRRTSTCWPARWPGHPGTSRTSVRVLGVSVTTSTTVASRHAIAVARERAETGAPLTCPSLAYRLALRP